MSQPGPRPLPRLHRLLPGAYYGWSIAIGGMGVSAVVVGVGFYGLTVFLDALCTERGWPRASVSFATTLFFVTSGVAGSLVGRSVDRRGPRGWMLGGAFVMAGALVAVGRVTAPWQLYLVYPLLAVGFSMAGPVPMSAIITRWFVARRARAMSISHTGVSLGGIVLVPLTVRLVAERGLDTATLWLAGLVLAVVLPVVLFVLRADPRRHGLEPDGGAVPESLADDPVQSRAWTAGEVLRTRSFWVLVASLGMILFCQVAVAMHQISLLRAHMDVGAGALAVSATAAGSLTARLVVGSFADRVSLRRLGVALMLVQALGLATFAVATSKPALYAASVVFGFTIGNVFMLQTLLVGALFGMRSFGLVLGLLQLLTQTASGLGPWVLGLLYERFGSYPPGVALLSGIAVAAAAMLSRVRPPEPPQSSSKVR